MHPFRSSPTRFSVLYITVLLSNGIFLTGRGALQRHPESQVHPCLHEAQPENRRQRHCHQLYRQTEPPPPQQQNEANAVYLCGITGGSSSNRSRRRQQALSGRALGHEARRRSHGVDHALPGAIKVSGADLGRGAPYLDGVYIRERNADINGAPHFKKRSKVRMLDYSRGEGGGEKIVSTHRSPTRLLSVLYSLYVNSCVIR